MKFEHFGIAVVELMSSGIITIAHNSAGPKTDIIGPASSGQSPKRIGYLADTAEQYADFAFNALLRYENEQYEDMRKDSITWIKDKFGMEQFNNKFRTQIQKLF